MFRRKLAALGVALGLLSLSACGSSGAQESDDGTVTIKTGILPSVGLAPLYLGMKKGFFAEQRIKIETQQAEGGAALLPAVTSGEIQVGFSNAVSLMLARQKGLPVRAIVNGPLQTEPGSGWPEDSTYDALLVAKDSPVRSVKDLAGKTIAVNTLKNIEEVLVKYAIDQSGGDSSKVKLVELPTSQMPGALEQGKVAAALAIDPYVTVALDQGARILLRPFEHLDPAASVSMYFASEEFIEKEPDTVKRFVAAMNKSIEYAQAHQDEARQEVVGYTEIDPALVERITLPYWSTDLNYESVEKLGDLAVQYKVLAREPDLDAVLGSLAEDRG
ncbi:MAG: nitrate ABC transporter substrate-binding protein [Streptosporangiales bacterium]|nr:nitrate ABC transporter substrate-binding protein [Streptosporangiales bacterium]